MKQAITIGSTIKDRWLALEVMPKKHLRELQAATATVMREERFEWPRENGALSWRIQDEGGGDA
jgi:hypothetical protein